MITLKIDGQAVEIDQKINPAITAEIADIEDPENSSSGYSKTVEIPFTPRNRRIFGFVNELFSREQFNNALHTAEYADDDTVIMCGIAQIEKFSYVTGADGQVVGGSFHVSVVGASFEWITNARKPVNELVSDQTVKYTMKEVYNNSVRQDASLIKFFPVDRGAFWTEGEEGMEPRTVLSIYDYHPFINVWGLIELIFSGYTLRTSIRESMQRLYCAGYIPQIDDLSYVKEQNEFSAGSSLDPEISYNVDSCINIFDDFNNEDKGYFGNNVLGHGTRIYPYTIFSPKDAITVIYEMQINYFVSMSGLPTSFGIGYPDTFMFGTGVDDENFMSEFYFPIESSAEYENRIENIDDVNEIGYYYTFIDVEYAGAYPFVRCMSESGNSSSGHGGVLNEWFILGHFYQGNKTLKIYLSRTDDGPWIDLKTFSGAKTIFIPLAATKGAELGLNFSKKVRTYPFQLKSGSAHSFAGKFKSSKYPWSGNIFYVKEGCTITPIIGNYIGINEEVGVSTIGGTESQLDFLASVRQMFNLMFYTNPLTKEVFIEPRSSFYNLDLGDLIDWRGKIDYSKEVVVEELGADVGNCLKLTYNDGNEVVERYNWKNRTILGAYSAPLLNKTSDDEQEIINPTFAPFLLREVASVGMVLPQEKSEKTQDLIEEIDLDITPIIGQFTQVKKRTAGTDRGDYPEYPQLVFQDVTAGANLGFDDLQTFPVIQGLNQYYQGNIAAYNYGRRLTVYLKLEPRDVEAILLPNSLKRDFRGVFLLRHDGENVPCLLEGINDYNPSGGASVECRFIVDPNIRMYENQIVITYNGVATAYEGMVMKYPRKKIV